MAWHNGSCCFALSCAICDKRKPKRFCPAVHGRICPQCCGEQREIVLDCPHECIYLQQAREHERGRALELVGEAELFAQIEIGQHFIHEHEHLILGLSYSLAKSARADHQIRDADLMATLKSLARSYEMLADSGLHYEPPMTSLAAQAIASDLQASLREYREAEQKHLGYSRLRDSEVFRALVLLLRMAYSHTSGRPKSRGFIDFLFRQFPEGPLISTQAGEASRLILP
jgi:hypothetical protein